MSKLNSKNFIDKAINIHGDKYDYSKTIYINCNTKIIIICKKHGEFEQRARAHIYGQGCYYCGIKSRSILKSKNKQDFIDEANKFHNFKYNYSKVQYSNMNNKIIILCPFHGEFKQRASKHLEHGCLQCGFGLCGKGRKSQEEFIESANKFHNFKYDYSLVNYKNNHTKVIIICPKHANFEQIPGSHLKSGCEKCGYEFSSKIRIKTQEKFIEEANAFHNFKYNYSLVNYIGSESNIIIICNIHGKFEQNPYSHLHRGCPKCSNKNKSVKSTKTQEKFIKKAKEIHGDKYNYSKTIYEKCNKKIIIICKYHGDFEQIPSSHLRGIGCDACGGTKLYTNEYIDKFILENNIKIQRLDNYKDSHTKINWICLDCKNKFTATPIFILKNKICKKCSIKNGAALRSKTTSKFLEEAYNIYNDRYDYSKTIYINYNTKISIICKEHGEFLKLPRYFLNYKDCPKCNKSKNNSKNEIITDKLLKKLNINFEREYKIKLPHNKKFSKVDFYLLDYNLIIEINGQQHYMPVQFNNITNEKAKNKLKKQEIRDENLRIYCKDNNIKLLEVDIREYYGKILEKYLEEYLKNI